VPESPAALEVELRTALADVIGTVPIVFAETNAGRTRYIVDMSETQTAALLAKLYHRPGRAGTR
jgi:hypothetical protein